MQSKKRRSSKKKTFLTAEISAICFALAACAGTPKVTPHILDTQLNRLREYEVMDPEKMTIRFKESHPLPRGRDGYGNGFFCAPQEEVVAWRDWCLKHECTKSKSIFMSGDGR